MGRRTEPLTHVCPRCGATKAWFADRIPYGLCITCRHKQKNQRRDPVYHKNYSMKKKYGLDPDQLERLVDATGGHCPACMRKYSRTRLACVDHDHASGLVRGVLCVPCNLAAGIAHDNAEWFKRMGNYLSNPPAPAIIGNVYVPNSIGEARG